MSPEIGSQVARIHRRSSRATVRARTPELRLRRCLSRSATSSSWTAEARQSTKQGPDGCRDAREKTKRSAPACAHIGRESPKRSCEGVTCRTAARSRSRSSIRPRATRRTSSRAKHPRSPPSPSGSRDSKTTTCGATERQALASPLRVLNTPCMDGGISETSAREELTMSVALAARRSASPLRAKDTRADYRSAGPGMLLRHERDRDRVVELPGCGAGRPGAGERRGRFEGS